MLQYLMTYMQTMLHNEDGQDLIEYALIIGLLVVAAIAGLGLLGDEIAGLWDAITLWLSGISIP